MVSITVHHGDSRDVLKSIPDNSVDSVVTDPPYSLVSIVERFGKDGAAPAKGNDAYTRASAGFMGQTWDTGETAFDPEFWREVWRVLKPGGFLIAASGTRTYHRLACAVEDAGFEIRDMISWLYGSGFPKSHDVSKGIDRAAGAVRAVVGSKLGKPGYSDTDTTGRMMPGQESGGGSQYLEVTAPATPEAQQWEGWGTALKPACEPWVLARKPLSEKSVAANVLRWGVGALNIDGCRVGESGATTRSAQTAYGDSGWRTGHEIVDLDKGRWPANVIHDGSPEVTSLFPSEAGAFAPVRGTEPSNSHSDIYNHRDRVATYHHDDSGSAARFFYTAKADATDRLGTAHPTVKPTDLMQYLIRLVTPPNGTVLDAFAGSGSTGVAAVFEAVNAILIEREAPYVADIERRIAWARGEGGLTLTERKRPKIKPNPDSLEQPLF